MSYVLSGDNRRFVENLQGESFELVHVSGPLPFKAIMDEVAPLPGVELPVYNVHETMIYQGRRVKARTVLLFNVTFIKAHEILNP